jgi:potassium-transporting ATPase KdpC subunit
MEIVRQMRSALLCLLAMTVLTGIAYPLLVTGIAQGVFFRQANGSLIESNGRSVGSALIGQPFSAPGYFWPRPSATPKVPYNGAESAGSNQGPLDPALLARVRAQVQALRAGAMTPDAPVPVDLVTASASGLDPHITPAGALFQVPRVARARGLDEGAVGRLVLAHIEGRTFGVLGEPRVNVLRLNLALDALRH